MAETKRIFKFPIPRPESVMQLPAGAVILSFDLQERVPTLWAMVDPEEEQQETWSVYVVGTGWNLPEGCMPVWYVGTAQDPPYVWHCFAIPMAEEALSDD